MRPVVAAWLVVNVSGVAVAFWSAVDAWLDLQALGDAGNGRRTVARSALVSQLMRLAKFALGAFLGTGVAVGWPVMNWAAEVLLVIAAVMLADSLLQARTQRQLRA